MAPNGGGGGSGRTLRKTACSTCVSAKRRCDSALPSCGRCTRMAANCCYPFPTVVGAARARNNTTSASRASNASRTTTSTRPISGNSADGIATIPRRRPIAPMRRPPLNAGTGPVAASQFSAAGWLAAGGVSGEFTRTRTGLGAEMEMGANLNMGTGMGMGINRMDSVDLVDPDLMQNGTVSVMDQDVDWSQFTPSWDDGALNELALDYSGIADGAVSAAAPSGAVLNALYFSPVEGDGFTNISGPSPWESTSISAAALTAATPAADHHSSDNESSGTSSPTSLSTVEKTTSQYNHENWSQYTRRAEKRQPPVVTYLAVRPPPLTHPAAPSRALASNRPYWPRGGDTATWMFCAGELLSYVEGFARTGSTHFILPLPHVENFDASLSLHRALGVCAARDTLGEGGRDAFEGMLEAEVAQLVESSMAMEPNLVDAYSGAVSRTETGNLVRAFRMELSRLQAMILYMTIRLFGPTERQRRLGEELEPLMAAWTRELLFKIRILERLYPPEGPSSSSVGPVEDASNSVMIQGGGGGFTQQSQPQHVQESDYPTAEEMQSAYRTVIISYMVRGVYAALVYQICHLVGEMATLPVVVSEPSSLGQDARIAHRRCLGAPDKMNGNDGGRDGETCSTQGLRPGCYQMSYGRLAESWDTHAMAPITEYDSFTQLLIVACKGVGIIPSKES